MKRINLLVGTILIVQLFSGCSNEPQAENTQLVEEQISTEKSAKEVGYTDFLNEILLGYEISAIQKHMVQTPYKFLGETEFVMNYEAIDEQNVVHFISFHKFQSVPGELGALAYNLDFKNSSSQLVGEYQEKLFQQLDSVYGEWSENFETGYNANGFFEMEWYFEAGTLRMTVGNDFIAVDLSEH
jgi:hypothetical protein